MLEILQTAALIIIAISILYYVLDKRIVIVPNKRVKELEDLLEKSNVVKHNTHKRAMQYKESMNVYQEKYEKAKTENDKLSTKMKQQEVRAEKFLAKIDAFNVKQYEKGEV